jgi:hypothetical protein
VVSGCLCPRHLPPAVYAPLLDTRRRRRAVASCGLRAPPLCKCALRYIGSYEVTFPHIFESSSGNARSTPEGKGTRCLLLQGQSTLGTELNTAWAPVPARARGAHLNTALHVSASAPSARLREVQVRKCKWAWLPPQQKTAREAGRGKHTPPQQLPSRGRTPTSRPGGGLPATRPGQKRLLELNAQAVDALGTRHSASGL